MEEEIVDVELFAQIDKIAEDYFKKKSKSSEHEHGNNGALHVLEPAKRKRELPSWVVDGRTEDGKRLSVIAPSHHKRASYSLEACFKQPHKINLPPLCIPQSAIIYVDDWSICENICCKLLESSRQRAKAASEPVVLGFDMEWPVQYTRGEAPLPTSLIQICDDEQVFLFHVCRFSRIPTDCHLSFLPPSLVELLGCAEILKAGLNISGDISKLHFDFQGLQNLTLANAAAAAQLFDSPSAHALSSAAPSPVASPPSLGNGFVELSDLAALRPPPNPRAAAATAPNEPLGNSLAPAVSRAWPQGTRWSLAGLTAAAAGLGLAKPEGVRRGNWAGPLGPEQRTYAAADAVASLRCFRALVPLRPAAAAADSGAGAACGAVGSGG